MAQFASALSQHPNSSIAVGEVIGHLSDQLDESPDVAVLFVSGSYLEDIGAISETVRQLLNPTCFIGCSAAGVLGGSQEISRGRGLSIWAACLPGAQTFRVEPGERGVKEFGAIVGELPNDTTAILLADPSTVPMESLLTEIDRTNARQAAGSSIVGGLASVASSSGPTVLLVDDQVVYDGGVGIAFAPGVARPVISQGCRQIASPWTVTKAEGQVIYELAGSKAMARLDPILDELGSEFRTLTPQDVLVGIVANENADALSSEDFLIRSVLGRGRSPGSITVDAVVSVGQVVQFHIRDEYTASGDLQHLLRNTAGRSALVFSCNGRGSQLFSDPDHDATLVYEHVGPAVGGMLCAGEIGPVGTKHALHGFAANLLVFS